jgi:hypothetical protein
MRPTKKELIGFSLLFAAFLALAFVNKNTFDSGDSIQHYLISHYAFQHPSLFLDHWGKPFFTILSAPFSQFGFIGIQFFNILVSVLSGYFVYKSAERLGYKTSYLPIALLFTATDYLLCMYSGLTEPLFGLVLILSVCLVLHEKFPAAALIISFLPFVRSEGNIILILFVVYFIFQKRYKLIPALAFGTLVISLLGIPIYKDITWVFTSNPYSASTLSNYGKGELLHYVKQLFFVAGLFYTILLVVGTVIFILKSYKISEWKSIPYQTEIFLLIFGSFFGYFVSHSIFWWQGWFHSFGMTRVLIAILPIGTLICLLPVNELLKKYPNKYILPILSFAMTGFLFSGNKAALDLKNDFSVQPTQAIALEMNEWYVANYKNMPIVASAPHIPFIMGKDFFSESECQHISTTKTLLPKNKLIIWDNWISVIEDGVTDNYLDSKKKLEMVKMFSNGKDTLKIYLPREIKQ